MQGLSSLPAWQPRDQAWCDQRGFSSNPDQAMPWVLSRQDSLALPDRILNRGAVGLADPGSYQFSRCGGGMADDETGKRWPLTQ